MGLLAPHEKAESQLGGVHARMDLAETKGMFIVGLSIHKSDFFNIDSARLCFDTPEDDRAEVLQDVALSQ